MRSSIRFLPLLLTMLGCQATRPARAVSPVTSHEAILDGVFDVGGLSLHLHCIGEGAPTVVLDAGLGNDGSGWNDVQPEVGRFARACVYDRAGLGYSAGPAPKPHAPRQMARELHALLQRAGLGGPYVLVGHSLGGVNLRLFAAEHPDEIAGMVLVDAVGDEQPSRYWALLPAAAMTEFRESLGKHREGMDFDTFVAAIAEMRASSRSIGDRPLVVLTRGKEEPLPGASPEQTAKMLRAWHEVQAELPRLSTHAVHVVAENSRHFLQWEAPSLVIASIREVVHASRSRTRINASALAAIARQGAP